MKPVLYTFVGFLCLVLFAGTASLSFKSVEGTITSSGEFKIPEAGGNGRYSIRQEEGVVRSIHYDYIVAETNFTGNVEAFWLLSSNDELYKSGQRVNVYYFPLVPKISVLRKGPDLLLLLICIFGLVGWFSVNLVIKGMVK